MTTLVRLAKRSVGVEVAEFQRDVDLTCDWASAAGFGLRSATRALTLPGGYRRGEPVYDVVDELRFDDEQAATSCLQDPIVRSRWTHPLLEQSTIVWLVVEEHVAKAGPVQPSSVKNYEIVTKRPDLDRAEFDRYWRDVHGPLAAQISPIRRYVQAHLAPGMQASGTAPFDGLAITWFDDTDAMRAGALTEVYAQTRDDELNFLAGELPFIITRERVTFPSG